MSEKQTILDLLRRNGSASAAAQAAGVSLRTFLRRAREHHVPVPKPGRPRVRLSPPQPSTVDKLIRAELQTLGAPLYGTPSPVDDVEVTLVRGVVLAHRDPTVASVLPVCFFHAVDKLDPQRLLHEAKCADEVQAVGFFLELTSMLAAARARGRA